MPIVFKKTKSFGARFRPAFGAAGDAAAGVGGPAGDEDGDPPSLAAEGADEEKVGRLAAKGSAAAPAPGMGSPFDSACAAFSFDR